MIGGACTSGRFATERDACASLDRLLDANLHLFDVHYEVPGRYVHVRPDDAQAKARPRIDRLVTPTARAVAAGWTWGPVGIECKRSGQNLGPAVAQCLDYKDAVYPIDGAEQLLERVFIWPLHKFEGPLASVLLQQRLGALCSLTLHPGWRYGADLEFDLGPHVSLAQVAAGHLTIGRGAALMRARVGSR